MTDADPFKLASMCGAYITAADFDDTAEARMTREDLWRLMRSVAKECVRLTMDENVDAAATGSSDGEVYNLALRHATKAIQAAFDLPDATEKEQG